MRMGKIRFSAAILSILFVLLAPDASSRVLLDNEKVSPSPLSNPATLPKTAVSQLGRKPTSDPNNTDGSVYPPPPGKLEGNPLTRGEDGSKRNPRDSTSRSGANKDDSAAHGNTAPENKDEGKDGRKGGDKQTNNSMDKKMMETCNSSRTKCDGNLVACLVHSRKDEKKLSIIIQNTGEDGFTVNIRGHPDLHIDRDTVAVSKNNSTEIDLPTEDQNVTKIILDAGRGKCVLQIETPAPSSNLFPQLSAYDIHVTPIYGLYVLVGTIVLVGATWACCKFQKRERREGSGVPYQQLEMSAQPQNGSPADLRPEDGWDDDWDDDWNDEGSTRPSEKYSRTSVSSNGLTSRTSKKDGWEDSWED